jgi:hypothetical protein
MSTALNPSLTFELVGQEALVHDAAGGLVVRLTGDEHSVIERLTSGEQIVHPTEGEQAAIDRLIEAGIVLDDEATSSKFSRRKVMQLSAAGVAAAGLSYLVLPSAAAAQSGGGGGGYENPDITIPTAPAGSALSENTSVGTTGGGQITVSWLQDGETSFNYVWAVYNPDGSIARQGAGASGITYATGSFLPAGTIVRFFVTGLVVDRTL